MCIASMSSRRVSAAAAIVAVTVVGVVTGFSMGALVVRLLLLFNTTRAHTPDPQAQEPLSQWTEVWPTQPVRTQAVNRHKVGEEETPS